MSFMTDEMVDMRPPKVTTHGGLGPIISGGCGGTISTNTSAIDHEKVELYKRIEKLEKTVTMLSEYIYEQQKPQTNGTNWIKYLRTKEEHDELIKKTAQNWSVHIEPNSHSIITDTFTGV